jgi:F0F1-type ATP synthase membrane subunit b/b'
MAALFLPALQFFLLLGFLGYKLKGPFQSFMVTRHADVTSGLNKSKTHAANSEQRKKEIELKIAGLAAEKQKIMTEWKEREALQIKAIHEGNQRLLNQMKTEAEQNKKALEEFYRHETLKSIGMLVAAQAEAKIRASLNAETHRKMNDRFAQVVGA